MYIDKNRGDHIGGTADRLAPATFPTDQKKEESPLGKLPAETGQGRQNGDFQQTAEQLGATRSDAPAGTPPSALARAMMEYLGCACVWFPPTEDDVPLLEAYLHAREEGAREGFVPVLVRVDEILWQCLVMNADPDSRSADGRAFDPKAVARYRRETLAAPVGDGKAMLAQRLGQLKKATVGSWLNWAQRAPGEMKGGEANDCFASHWNPFSRTTYPLLLAKIPVKDPWEVFAYLPFGGWNDCPDTPALMAAAKYWFEQYGAVPGVITHDELEFDLPAPVPREKALDTALEQYAFCTDVDQGGDWSIGALADSLRQSTVWYLWWD